MAKIFAIYCPECNAETPLSVKRKEVLAEMKVECPKCPWNDFADNGIIKEKSFEDGITSY